MTDIEAKALALVNELFAESGGSPIDYAALFGAGDIVTLALLRAIEQHEAFKQAVGDIALAYRKRAFTVSEPHLSGYRVLIGFDRSADADAFFHSLPILSDFIPKPKPDPLVDVFDECFHRDVPEGETWSENMARCTRAALEARGLEIREKGQ